MILNNKWKNTYNLQTIIFGGSNFREVISEKKKNF